MKFKWNDENQRSLDMLKQKMVAAPILVFLDWTKEFHVHANALLITLGVILAQPGEASIDHPISFVSQKLSTAEKNYMTT